MRRIEKIIFLLDLASKIADEEAVKEPMATDPYTTLGQQIDTAMANAIRMDIDPTSSMT